MRRRATHFATAFSHSLASFFLLVLVAVPSRALDPDLNVSQYAHTAWRVQDGYFSSAPRTMTQTSDGYLWIGTQSGLVRFDGSRFLPWTPPDGKSLPSSTILSLLGAHDGSLWIGTRAGLAHFVNQKLVQFPDFHDRVYGILEDSSGNIWISHQNDVEAQRRPDLRSLWNDNSLFGQVGRCFRIGMLRRATRQRRLRKLVGWYRSGHSPMACWVITDVSPSRTGEHGRT